LWFANDLLPLNLLDYGTWGILRAKGNAMSHPKMGSLKQTIWQMQAAKLGDGAGKLPRKQATHGEGHRH
jgi:hypothetical protein